MFGPQCSLKHLWKSVGGFHVSTGRVNPACVQYNQLRALPATPLSDTARHCCSHSGPQWRLLSWKRIKSSLPLSLLTHTIFFSFFSPPQGHSLFQIYTTLFFFFPFHKRKKRTTLTIIKLGFFHFHLSYPNAAVYWKSINSHKQAKGYKHRVNSSKHNRAQ